MLILLLSIFIILNGCSGGNFTFSLIPPHFKWYKEVYASYDNEDENIIKEKFGIELNESCEKGQHGTVVTDNYLNNVECYDNGHIKSFIIPPNYSNNTTKFKPGYKIILDEYNGFPKSIRIPKETKVSEISTTPKKCYGEVKLPPGYTIVLENGFLSQENIYDINELSEKQKTCK